MLNKLWTIWLAILAGRQRKSGLTPILLAVMLAAGWVAPVEVDSATSGVLRLYLHAEPSEESSTYNSMLPSVTPEGDTQDLGTDNSSQNWTTPPCEATGFTYPDNSARVNEETDSAERCVATFYGPIVGGTMQIDNTDTNSIDYSLWATEEGNCTTCVLRARLYEYVESGSTFNLIDTSDSAAVTAAGLTNITWSSTPDTTTTVNPGNRLVLVVTMYTGTGEDTSGGTDTINVDFDRLTSAPAYMNLDYTLTTADHPDLTAVADDDFDTAGSCASNCDGTTLQIWTMETSGNTTTESLRIDAGGSAGSSGWLALTDVKTADLVPTTLANYTYVYQSVVNVDGTISTQVSSSHATYPTTDPRDLAGLLLRFSSDADFLILQTYYDGANNVVEVNDSGTLSGTTATITGNANNILLLWRKSGTSYQAKYCTSDTTDCTVNSNWTNLGTAVTKATTLDRVGLTSFVEWVTGTNTEYTAAFEWFNATLTLAYTWDGGGGDANWNTANNWSTNVVPGTSNRAIFDATCSSNCSATVNVDVDVKGIVATSGYSATITGSSGVDIKVGTEDFVLNGGTFTTGGNNVTIYDAGDWDMTGGTFTSTNSTVMFTGTSSALTITSNTKSFNNVIINDGLIGYWKLDESNDNDKAIDSSGYANHGTATGFGAGGGPTTTVTSTINFNNPRSLEFDGADDVVNAGNDVELQNVNTFTYCAWVYPQTLGESNDGRIVHKGTAGARKQLQSENTLTNAFGLLVNRATADAVAFSVANTITLNAWQHVCGTYSESDGPRIYKNGVEVSYNSRTVGSGNTSSDSGDNLYIGNRADLARTWDGYIDEVRIYNRILSTTEMLRLANGNMPATGLGTYTLQDNLDVNGTLTLNAGELNTGSNRDINVGRSWMNHGGIFTANSGDVFFDGSSSNALILSGSQTFYNVDVTGSGVWTLQDDVPVSSVFDVSAGTLTYATSTLIEPINIDGNTTITGGTFTGQSTRFRHDGNISVSSGTYTAPTDVLEITGSFAQTGGAFNNSGSTVIFEGTDTHTINTSSGTVFQDVIINDGLVGYWKLDETASPSRDSSGYGSNGTWTNITSSTSVPAEINFHDPRSAAFDATAYIRMPNNNALDISGTGITIAVWANVVDEGSGGSDQILVGKPYFDIGSFADPFFQYDLEYDDNGANTYDFYFSSSSGVFQGPFSVTPTIGQWNHVAFTYDGSFVRGYINGNNALTTAETDQLVARGFDLIMGMDGALSQEFNGTMDEVRIYNRALSSAEIQRLANGIMPSDGLGVYTLQSNLDIDGTLRLNSGTLDVSGSNRQINVGGDWENFGGIFVEQAGTVVMDGSNQQIPASETFYNLSKTLTAATSRTLTFGRQSTVTVSNTLTLQGFNSSSRLNLRSSSVGTRFNVKVTAGQQTVSYVDVKDSEALSNNIRASYSANSGNTDTFETPPRWIFGPLRGAVMLVD